MPMPSLSSIHETFKAQKRRLNGHVNRFDDWCEEALANKGLYFYRGMTAAQTMLANGAKATGTLLHTTGTALRSTASEIALRTGLTEKLYTARTATADFVQDHVSARFSGITRSFGTLNGSIDRTKGTLAGKVNTFTHNLQQRWEAADARKAAKTAAAAESLEARRAEKSQNNLHRNYGLIRNSLQQLSEERPDFQFDVQQKTILGMNAIVLTTNIPSRSQPVGSFASITIMPSGIMLEGIEKRDSSTTSANSALARMTRLVSTVAPKRALTQAELEARMNPLELQAIKSARQRAVQASKPEQQELAAQENYMVDHLSRLRAAVPGFNFTVRPFFDEQQGKERVMIDTNLQTAGNDSKPSDTFKLFLNKEGSQNDTVRIGGFADGGSKEHATHTALNLISRLANLMMQPPKLDNTGRPVLREVQAMPRKGAGGLAPAA